MSETHKELLAGVFGRSAASYDQIGPGYFAHFGRRLVEHAGLSAGDCVLDIASGRGAVLFPAAERVGPSGSVTGIDLTPEMVAETGAEITRRGITNAEIVQRDAEHLDFPEGTFDAVVCGFAIFFFPRQSATLKSFQRILRPSGRIAVSVWGEPSARSRRFNDRLKAYGIENRMSPSPVGSPARLTEVLEKAGFVDVEVKTETQEFFFADEDVWWEQLWTAGLRDNLERLEPSRLAEFKSECMQDIRSLLEPAGLRDQRQAHFGLGRKA